jgi:hypothetical protein
MSEDQAITPAIEKERPMLSGPKRKPQFKYAIVQMLRIRRPAQFFVRGQTLGPSKRFCLIFLRQISQVIKKRTPSIFQAHTASNKIIRCPI